MITAVREGHDPDSVIDEAKKKTKAKAGGSAPRLSAYNRQKKRKTSKKVTTDLSKQGPSKQAAALAKSSKTLKQAMDKLNFFVNRLGVHMSDDTWSRVVKVFDLLPKQSKFKK
jgi:hypothetical protein